MLSLVIYSKNRKEVKLVVECFNVSCLLMSYFRCNCFVLMNQGRTRSEGCSTENKLMPRVILLLAFLFLCVGGFRCGVWLCFVILVRYKNRK